MRGLITEPKKDLNCSVVLHDAFQKSWTCKSSSPVGFQPIKTASIVSKSIHSREAVWFDYDFKWTVKLISFASIICFRSFSLRWSVQVLTGPALTNRIEHVYKSRGKYEKGETIKRGSIEVSKTIENKIIKKISTLIFNPWISRQWSSYWNLYKDECHVDEFKSMRSLLPTLAVRLLFVSLKIQEGIN